MATIVIKDLPDNIALDREAMTAITGGARRGGRQSIAAQPLAGRTILRNTKIVNFPTGYLGGSQAAGRSTPK